MMFSIQYLTIVAVLLPFITAQANCRSDPRSAVAIATEVTSGHRPQLGDPRSRPLKPVDSMLTPRLEAGTINWGFQRGRASSLVASGVQTPRANLIDCFSGGAEFVAPVQGRRFLAPCRFITQTAEHLKKILKSEGAKQPFALDVDHAHLAVAAETWDEKYRNMHRDDILPVLLRDTSLVAIYHSVCHTPIADRKHAGTTGPTFVGFYDGRSIEQLPSRKAGSDPAHAQYYRTFAWFYTSVNKSGELVLSTKDQSAAIDIFFDDEDPPVPVPDIVSVSTRTN